MPNRMFAVFVWFSAMCAGCLLTGEQVHYRTRTSPDVGVEARSDVRPDGRQNNDTSDVFIASTDADGSVSDILATDGSEEDASEDVETADGDGSSGEDGRSSVDASDADAFSEADVLSDVHDGGTVRDASRDAADGGTADAGRGTIVIEYTHPTGRTIGQLWVYFLPPGSPVDPMGLMLLPALCVGGFVPGPRVRCEFSNTVPPGTRIRLAFSYSSTYPAWDEEASWVCNRLGGSIPTACPGNPDAYRFYYEGALLPNPTPIYLWGTQSDPMRPDGMGGTAQTNYIHRLLPGP